MKKSMFFLLLLLPSSVTWGFLAERELSERVEEKGASLLNLIDCRIVKDESSSVESEFCGKFDKCSTLDSVFTSLLRDAKLDTNIKVSDFPDKGELVIFGSYFLQKVSMFHPDQTLEGLIKNSISGKSELSLKIIFYLESKLTPRIRD